jgi:hypothetical protein
MKSRERRQRTSPVSLIFLQRVREPLMRQFVEAAVIAADLAAAS